MISRLKIYATRVFNDFPISIGVFATLVFFSHYLLLGKSSVIYDNDYLELTMPWFQNLINSNAIFELNSFQIDGLIHSLPRAVYPSEFYVETWLHYFLDPIDVFLVSKLLIHSVAFFAMYIFLVSESGNASKMTIWLLSLLWSTSWFWLGGGIGMAAAPLILYIFRSILTKKKPSWRTYLFLFFYATYSQIYLHGIFIILLLLGLGFYTWLITKEINFSYWKILGVFGFMLLAVNYRLIIFYFFSTDELDFISHREEYDIRSMTNFHSSLIIPFIEYFFSGMFHLVKYSPALGVLTLVALVSVVKKRMGYSSTKKIIWVIGIVLTFASLITYEPFAIALTKVEIFSQLRIERVLLIMPVLLILLLSKQGESFSVPIKIWNVSILFILVYNFFILDENIRNTVVKPLTGLGDRFPDYEAYYGESQFSAIKNYLDANFDGYFVGSVGLPPGIAVFNQLPSLDGYAGLYDIRYKHKFYKIIQDELGKPCVGDIKQHFLGWGNKCYLFTCALGDDFRWFKWRERNEIEVNFNWEEFKSLGGKIILSTHPLQTKAKDIQLLQVFSHSKSAWEVYCYEVL